MKKFYNKISLMFFITMNFSACCMTMHENVKENMPQPTSSANQLMEKNAQRLIDYQKKKLSAQNPDAPRHEQQININNQLINRYNDPSITIKSDASAEFNQEMKTTIISKLQQDNAQLSLAASDTITQPLDQNQTNNRDQQFNSNLKTSIESTLPTNEKSKNSVTSQTFDPRNIVPEGSYYSNKSNSDGTVTLIFRDIKDPKRITGEKTISRTDYNKLVELVNQQTKNQAIKQRVQIFQSLPLTKKQDFIRIQLNENPEMAVAFFNKFTPEQQSTFIQSLLKNEVWIMQDKKTIKIQNNQKQKFFSLLSTDQLKTFINSPNIDKEMISNLYLILSKEQQMELLPPLVETKPIPKSTNESAISIETSSKQITTPSSMKSIETKNQQAPMSEEKIINTFPNPSEARALLATNNTLAINNLKLNNEALTAKISDLHSQHASLMPPTSYTPNYAIYYQNTKIFRAEVVNVMIPEAKNLSLSDDEILHLYEAARGSLNLSTNWLARANNDNFNTSKFKAWQKETTDFINQKIAQKEAARQQSELNMMNNNDVNIAQSKTNPKPFADHDSYLGSSSSSTPGYYRDDTSASFQQNVINISQAEASQPSSTLFVKPIADQANVYQESPNAFYSKNNPSLSRSSDGSDYYRQPQNATSGYVGDNRSVNRFGEQNGVEIKPATSMEQEQVTSIQAPTKKSAKSKSEQITAIITNNPNMSNHDLDIINNSTQTIMTGSGFFNYRTTYKLNNGDFISVDSSNNIRASSNSDSYYNRNNTLNRMRKAPAAEQGELIHISTTTDQNNSNTSNATSFADRDSYLGSSSNSTPDLVPANNEITPKSTTKDLISAKKQAVDEITIAKKNLDSADKAYNDALQKSEISLTEASLIEKEKTKQAQINAFTRLEKAQSNLAAISREIRNAKKSNSTSTDLGETAIDTTASVQQKGSINTPESTKLSLSQKRPFTAEELSTQKTLLNKFVSQQLNEIINSIQIDNSVTAINLSNDETAATQEDTAATKIQNTWRAKFKKAGKKVIDINTPQNVTTTNTSQRTPVMAAVVNKVIIKSLFSKIWDSFSSWFTNPKEADAAKKELYKMQTSGVKNLTDQNTTLEEQVSTIATIQKSVGEWFNKYFGKVNNSTAGGN